MRGYADSHFDQERITGGWSMDAIDGGAPTREQLETVCPWWPPCPAP
ncbi:MULTISPECIES: hypothetical protein [Streptomyces]|nr:MULTISPECIES: hypothetical protein [Streptomyces]